MYLPYRGAFRLSKLYGTAPPAGMHYASGRHAGLDLVGTESREILAVQAGEVVRAAYDADGWGNYVSIRQTDGLWAIYCHLAEKRVRVGESVSAGCGLGIEGMSGQATGRHCHFELRRNYHDRYSTENPAVYLHLIDQKGAARMNHSIEAKTLTVYLNGEAKTLSALTRTEYKSSGGLITGAASNFVSLRELAGLLGASVNYRNERIEILRKAS